MGTVAIPEAHRAALMAVRERCARSNPAGDVWAGLSRLARATLALLHFRGNYPHGLATPQDCAALRWHEFAESDRLALAALAVRLRDEFKPAGGLLQ